MKKLVFLLVFVLVFTGCTSEKSSFNDQAIKAIKKSKHVEGMCEELGAKDVEVKILNKKVKDDTAEVECEVTYKNGCVEAVETLECELEKWDDGWQIEDVDSIEDIEYEPVKFPEDVEFFKDTEEGNGFWIVRAENVITTWYSEDLISLGLQYDVMDVEWNTYDVSDDYTEGSVDIVIKIRDYEDDFVYSGNLEFDSDEGCWIMEFEESSDDMQPSVYYLNYKPELDYAWCELAKQYEKETGISVTVLTAVGGSYNSTLQAELDTENAPTLFQVNGPDGLAMWKDYCYDLTDAKVTKELTSSAYTLQADGKVYGVGYVVESYGIIVNKTLLKEAGYEISDIASFDDLKFVAEDITAHSDELGFSAFSSAGMHNTSDWRFKTHLANLPIYFEYLADGINTTDAIKGTYLDNYRDIFDLYINNSTCEGKDLSDKTGDDSENEFLNGEAVFYQNGSWVYSWLTNVYSSDELAMIPIYIGVGDEANQGLCTGTENFWCVNKNASTVDIQATLDFMYWCVTSETGTKAMADDMGLTIPFKNAVESRNGFVMQDVAYTAEGKEPVTWNFSTMPSENWKNGVGSALTTYAANPTDANWDKVEDAFVDGWAREYEYR